MSLQLHYRRGAPGAAGNSAPDGWDIRQER